METQKNRVSTLSIKGLKTKADLQNNKEQTNAYLELLKQSKEVAQSIIQKPKQKTKEEQHQEEVLQQLKLTNRYLVDVVNELAKANNRIEDLEQLINYNK
jgi:hypothetical protein